MVCRIQKKLTDVNLISTLLTLLLFGVLVVTTCYVALERFIARDEGFYLYAAKLVAQGQVPYRDFFFPQAPLSPYIFSLWMNIANFSWISARACAAFFTIGCGGLIYLFTRAYFGRWAALLALPLFAMTVAIQAWMPIAKNTVLATFLLLLALYMGLIRKQSGWGAFFMGLSVLTRLTYAPLGLLLLFPTGQTWREYRTQLRGLLLGCLPSLGIVLFFYLQDPFNFLQDNWVYHQQRSNLSDKIFARKRWRLVNVLFGLKKGTGMGGYQVLGLGVAALCGFVGSLRTFICWWPLALIIAILFAVSLLPEPAYLQYFSPFVMLLIPLSSVGLLCASRAISRILPLHRLRGAVVLLAIFVGMFWYGGEGKRDFTRFLITGDDVIGVGRHNSRAWRLAFVSKVAKVIDEQNVSRKPVFSSWPGYLLETDSGALSGTENQFGHTWANYERMTATEQEKRHIMTRKRVLEAYANEEFDVYALFIGKGRTTPLERAVRKQGAKRARVIDGFSLYSR
jgi:hypothetical protein